MATENLTAADIKSGNKWKLQDDKTLESLCDGRVSFTEALKDLKVRSESAIFQRAYRQRDAGKLTQDQISGLQKQVQDSKDSGSFQAYLKSLPPKNDIKRPSLTKSSKMNSDASKEQTSQVAFQEHTTSEPSKMGGNSVSKASASPGSSDSSELFEPHSKHNDENSFKPAKRAFTQANTSGHHETLNSQSPSFQGNKRVRLGDEIGREAETPAQRAVPNKKQSIPNKKQSVPNKKQSVPGAKISTPPNAYPAQSLRLKKTLLSRSLPLPDIGKDAAEQKWASLSLEELQSKISTLEDENRSLESERNDLMILQQKNEAIQKLHVLAKRNKELKTDMEALQGGSRNGGR